jgi:hypothetical protein
LWLHHGLIFELGRSAVTSSTFQSPGLGQYGDSEPSPTMTCASSDHYHKLRGPPVRNPARAYRHWYPGSSPGPRAGVNDILSSTPDDSRRLSRTLAQTLPLTGMPNLRCYHRANLKRSASTDTLQTQSGYSFPRTHHPRAGDGSSSKVRRAGGRPPGLLSESIRATPSDSDATDGRPPRESGSRTWLLNT